MSRDSNLFHGLNTKFYELILGLSEEQWNSKILFDNLTIKDLIFKHLHDSRESLNQLNCELQLVKVKQNFTEEFNLDVLISDLKLVHQHLAEYFKNIPISSSQVRVKSDFVVAIDLLKIFAETWLFQQKIRHILGKSILLEPLFYFPFLEFCFRLLPAHLTDVTVPNGTIVSITIVAEENLIWQLGFEEGTWTFTENQDDVDLQIYIDQNIAWLIFSGAIEVYEASQYWQIIGNHDLGQKVLAFRPFE